MIAWGVIVFVGLWLILADVGAVRKAKLMGNPILVHIIVIGSGLLIHGGSADGAMAAIVSGCFSALYVRWQQRIMDALPHTVPQLITPWWRREFVITPAAALGAAGALIALTAALTALFVVIAHR